MGCHCWWRLDLDVGSELKACQVETNIVKIFEGHSERISCIDISADSTLLASGSWDRTVRIWNLDTGKLVAGPLKSVNLTGAVRFSQDSKKLAIRGTWGDYYLEVWDVQTQKLDVRIGKRVNGVFFHVPVFWTTKDKTIVAAFSFNEVVHSADEEPKTIYEFDASTLETVGAPFEGHAYTISGLALSFDCALLASASFDNTIKLWAFESRQLLASFDLLIPSFLVFSP
ncbi:WD40-repeat-containing domain protein [Suillus paluster]|uniref:WD40-repeat-containing domain protein n=1 Tax=Suillus paluster TaxID=48578 RepID=UPI001B875161|nr:WD40-repeat-containing domain protein [Suillus paluster]KAG1752493.1 WD40-repeat-containing domain protein [Suillus paluster]